MLKVQVEVILNTINERSETSHKQQVWLQHIVHSPSLDWYENFTKNMLRMDLMKAYIIYYCTLMTFVEYIN